MIDKTKWEALIFPLIICLCVIVITILAWQIIVKTRKYNAAKKELELNRQRIKLYEKNIYLTHKQIDEITKIKHDMKNNLMCIEKLISNGELTKAKKLCNDNQNKLNATYTPINTENLLLNAIVNVELEKAVSNDIEFTVNINDAVTELSDTNDIVLIIGNICDNAIEYLKTVSKEFRQMSLEITAHNKYHIITCKNKIQESVLTENPLLKSSKNDLTLHGKGKEIIESAAIKYDGCAKFYENDGFFYSSVILKRIFLPEN